MVDRSGKLVTNLPQKAFKVYENGVEQQIKIFRREDIPVSLGLVIDNSGSMRPRRQKVEAAALQLVKASNPQDQVFIVNFNDEAYLDCPFTNSIAKLEEGLARIDSRGGTAMRDAISMSIDYMKEEGKLDKKVILVVTDGDDNMSSITLEELVRKAQQSRGPDLRHRAAGRGDAARGQDTPSARWTRSPALRAGSPTIPQELPEVERIALQVAHEIRNQYMIAYTPVQPQPGWQLPPDPSRGGRTEQTDGPDAHRLLRNSRAQAESTGVCVGRHAIASALRAADAAAARGRRRLGSWAFPPAVETPAKASESPKPDSRFHRAYYASPADPGWGRAIGPPSR